MGGPQTVTEIITTRILTHLEKKKKLLIRHVTPPKEFKRRKDLTSSNESADEIDNEQRHDFMYRSFVILSQHV
jgi:hypothetical protein